MAASLFTFCHRILGVDISSLRRRQRKVNDEIPLEKSTQQYKATVDLSMRVGRTSYGGISRIEW